MLGVTTLALIERLTVSLLQSCDEAQWSGWVGGVVFVTSVRSSCYSYIQLKSVCIIVSLKYFADYNVCIHQGFCI